MSRITMTLMRRFMIGFIRHTAAVCAVLVVLAAAVSCGQSGAPPQTTAGTASLLPPTPEGWQEIGARRTYAGVDLSNYINGGAEAYFAYGFREVAVREFRSDRGARLTVEIYEMDRPENAYGIFSTDTGGERWPMGAEAAYGDGLLRFYKGPYFVRIMCFPPAPWLESVIREAGTRVADAITADSTQPGILKLLPDTSIVPDSICYFHRQTSLNNIRFISGENLLRLGDDIDALTWEQEIASPQGTVDRVRNIVVRYPSDSTALAAFDGFAQNYLGGAASGADANDVVVAEISDGTHASATRTGRWISIALDADSAASAAIAVSETHARIEASRGQEGTL